MAGRLTDLAGSSAYVLGGLVVYSNEAKTALAGVPASLIEAHGAVSPEVARRAGAGARARLGADIGIGITGIAGPGGGSPEKPVGTVCLCVGRRRGRRGARRPPARARRADVRDRTTTVAMHMLRALLLRAASPAAARLFVAARSPARTRATRSRALRDYADPDVWRRRAADGLHVTLAFLGAARRTTSTITPIIAAEQRARAAARPRPRLLLPPRRAGS